MINIMTIPAMIRTYCISWGKKSNASSISCRSLLSSWSLLMILSFFFFDLKFMISDPIFTNISLAVIIGEKLSFFWKLYLRPAILFLKFFDPASKVEKGWGCIGTRYCKISSIFSPLIFFQSSSGYWTIILSGEKGEFPMNVIPALLYSHKLGWGNVKLAISKTEKHWIRFFCFSISTLYIAKFSSSFFPADINSSLIRSVFKNFNFFWKKYSPCPYSFHLDFQEHIFHHYNSLYHQ